MSNDQGSLLVQLFFYLFKNYNKKDIPFKKITTPRNRKQ